MAATTCVYGYDSPSAPAPAPAAMDPLFNNRSHGHVVLGSIIHGVAMPPPPPPPPLPDLHLGARSSHSSSKAASRDPGLCTEGLGSESSESSGDVDLGGTGDVIEGNETEQELHYFDDHVPARTRGRRAFPPPISVIGAAGKPWQYLRAHRGEGRLVLREVRIPSRELLHACREDGRLKLHFAHRDQENSY